MFGIQEKLEKRKLKGLWHYTLAFSVVMLLILGIFYYFDRSFVWKPDGEDIYFVIMSYTRNYITGVLKTLLHTGKLVFPQWDFSIGQGNNVLVGAHFSPFFLISLLTPARFQEYAYDLMVVLQLYCTGVAFFLFGRRVGQTDAFSMTMGALVYTFCGFVFHAGFSHIYFVTNLMLYLPLILAAAERYLQQRKWGCFVCVITITLISGYYYAYIDTLLMTVYLVIRQLCVNGKDLKKSFFELMRLFLLYLWGFALSMVIFLPSVMNYFACARVGTEAGHMDALYSLGEYREMFYSFVSPQMSGNWTQTSFAGIALIALTIVFLRRERETLAVRWSFVVLTAFLCLPYAGKVFNGMGYVSNRWCYGYALCVAMATVYGTRDLWKLDQRQKKIVSAVAAGWMVLALAMSRQRNVIVGAVLLALVLLAVLKQDKSQGHEGGKRMVAAVTVFALCVNTCIFFLPPFQNGIGDYKEGGKVVSSIQKTPEMAAKQLEDDSFYRVEVPATRTNRFALTGENGTSSYWSALPGKMTKFYQSFELASVRQSYAVWGLDGSTAVCALAGVKYDLTKDETGESVPYGFEQTGTVTAKKTTYQVYTNRYALPMGYTYDAGMTQAQFDELTPVERQQAMLQRAVLEQLPQSLPEKQPELNVQKLGYTITGMDGVKSEDGRTFHAEADGTVTLSFDGVPDSETYLYLSNVESGKRSDLTVSSGEVSRKTSLYKAHSIHYFPREGISFNLGYSKQGKNTCTLSFQNKGKYSFDLAVYALPMQEYVRDVTERGEQVMEDIHVGTDEVTGVISLNEPRLLVLNIPHIGGWSATVNGEPAELLEVNALYMGLMLDAGDYDIRLEYHMPGLHTGMMITGAAAAALVLYSVAAGHKRRKIQAENRKK